jgi:hypothetical protein
MPGASNDASNNGCLFSVNEPSTTALSSLSLPAIHYHIISIVSDDEHVIQIRYLVTEQWLLQCKHTCLNTTPFWFHSNCYSYIIGILCCCISIFAKTKSQYITSYIITSTPYLIWLALWVATEVAYLQLLLELDRPIEVVEPLWQLFN